MNKDPLAVLTAIRPTCSADDLWAAEVQGDIRKRIQAHPFPPVARRRSIRRRAATAAAAGAVLTAMGVTAANASGVIPQAFTEAFDYWSTTPVDGYQGIDPATAVRVAGTTGPDGTLFNVYVAQGEDGYHCIAGAFENPSAQQSSQPPTFSDTGSECRVGVNTREFGPAGSSITYDPSVYFYTFNAGPAVRATLHTSAGPAVPPVLVEGTFYGWYRSSAGSDWLPWPTLTGYAEDGSVVGEAQI